MRTANHSSRRRGSKRVPDVAIGEGDQALPMVARIWTTGDIATRLRC